MNNLLDNFEQLKNMYMSVKTSKPEIAKYIPYVVLVIGVLWSLYEFFKKEPSVTEDSQNSQEAILQNASAISNEKPVNSPTFGS